MRSQKIIYKDIIFAWFWQDFFLPVFIISVFYPVVSFFLKKAHAFDRVFHTADLVPLGAILLISATREIQTEYELGRISGACSKRRSLALVCSVCLLFTYGLIKYFTFGVNIPDDSSKQIDFEVAAISIFSIFSLLFCMLFSLFLKSSIYKQIKE
jgi:hypothetical protein